MKPIMVDDKFIVTSQRCVFEKSGKILKFQLKYRLFRFYVFKDYQLEFFRKTQIEFWMLLRVRTMLMNA